MLPVEPQERLLDRRVIPRRTLQTAFWLHWES